MPRDINSDYEETRLKRWRLALGGAEGDGIGVELNMREMAIDKTISMLYDGSLSRNGDRKGSLDRSSPNIAKWLGDIRTYFPSSIVKVMQQDALDRFGLKQLLLEPELLAATEPDVHLVATLIALKSLIPQKTLSTAREVVGKVVDDILRRLATEMINAVAGSINKASRNNRPKHKEIDWDRTIKANLKHYQAAYGTIIPVRQIGYSRRRSSLRDIILCLDQSGSMAGSIVYASVFGAVLASLPAISTRVVAFDTSVVDLTENIHDPIDLLFGVQLGGGTDINRALAYCQSLISRPQDTIVILISDLYEGGNREEMFRRAGAIALSGAQMITLLALNDEGAPSYDHTVAEGYAALGIPSFACTPDLFPDLLAAAISRKDITQWTANHDIAAARASK